MESNTTRIVREMNRKGEEFLHEASSWPKYKVMRMVVGGENALFFRGDPDPTNLGRNIWYTPGDTQKDIENLMRVHYEKTGIEVPKHEHPSSE